MERCMITPDELHIGIFGHFYDAKNVNGTWLLETWETLEAIGWSERMIGIYNGFNLVYWAIERGLITTDECRTLYALLLPKIPGKPFDEYDIDLHLRVCTFNRGQSDVFST